MARASTADPVEGAAQPLRLRAQRPREFRAYAPRARWIRTANDSYFTAMAYPEGLGRRSPPTSTTRPGGVSAVYGGAVIRPPRATPPWPMPRSTRRERVLGLKPPPDITAEPLPPLQIERPQ